jgi:hypothetical protein
LLGNDNNRSAWNHRFYALVDGGLRADEWVERHRANRPPPTLRKILLSSQWEPPQNQVGATLVVALRTEIRAT